MGNGLVLLLGGVAFFAGLIATYWGYDGRKPYRLVEETPTKDVGEVAPGEIAAVNARVEGAVDSTMRSPIRGTDDTVLAVWKAEEWVKRRAGLHGWRTVASGVRSTGFVLEDDTGEVVVKSPNGRARHSTGIPSWSPKVSNGFAVGNFVCEFREFPRVETVGVEEQTPETVSSFVASERTLEPQQGSFKNAINRGNAHGDRRYYEETVKRHQSVYVLGRAYETDDGRTGLTEPSDGEGFLVVSDRDREELVGGRLAHRIATGVGTVLVVVGIAFVAVSTGTI